MSHGPKYNFPYGNENFRLIAHRGNVTGPCEYENNPEYLKETMNDGFDVEVDVWFNASIKETGKFDTYFPGLYLGHDKPQYKIDFEFLEDKRIWVHAKNWQALDAMLKHPNPIHCFWHQNDDYTFTSHGFVWTYPDKPLTSKSIAMFPDGKPQWIETLKRTCAGVCSDYLK